jgi:hypothetical protein
MPIVCHRTKVVLNQTESLALREMLRWASADRPTEIDVWSYENGQREIQILVGDLASRMILQTKIVEET